MRDRARVTGLYACTLNDGVKLAEAEIQQKGVNQDTPPLHDGEHVLFSKWPRSKHTLLA